MDWTPLILSLKLAATTTSLLAVFSILLVYGLLQLHHQVQPFFKSLVSLPLVLPPTVLGYYLLLAFSPRSQLGLMASEWLGLDLLFSFGGLVVASLIFSLPFMVNPLLSAVEALPDSLTDASYTLGRSRWYTYRRVLLPNARQALLTGMVLTFAHTIGEFGVILMIGGSIPGITKVASIAIYQEVEAMNYAAANAYALVLLGLSWAVLLLIYMRRWRLRTI